MKKYIIALFVSALCAGPVLAQTVQKTGVEIVAEHFRNVPSESIDHNYFQKLINTMNSDIISLKNMEGTASNEQQVIKKTAVKNALEAHLKANKNINKEQLMKFVSDFLGAK